MVTSGTDDFVDATSDSVFAGACALGGGSTLFGCATVDDVDSVTADDVGCVTEFETGCAAAEVGCGTEGSTFFCAGSAFTDGSIGVTTLADSFVARRTFVSTFFDVTSRDVVVAFVIVGAGLVTFATGAAAAFSGAVERSPAIRSREAVDVAGTKVR